MISSALNGRKRRPTHPGAFLRDEILPAVGITQAELARRIGVGSHVVRELCRGKRAVSADLAHRLSRLFDTSVDVWLNMQLAVDIWDELRAHKHEYNRIAGIKLTDDEEKTSNPRRISTRSARGLAVMSD
jgi:antitoxin HigA-1